MTTLIKDKVRYVTVVNVQLKKILDEKNISRFKLSTDTKTKMDTINRMYYNNIYKIDLDVLARICVYLHCDISDLLELENKR